MSEGVSIGDGFCKHADDVKRMIPSFCIVDRASDRVRRRFEGCWIGFVSGDFELVVES